MWAFRLLGFTNIAGLWGNSASKTGDGGIVEDGTEGGKAGADDGEGTLDQDPIENLGLIICGIVLVIGKVADIGRIFRDLQTMS